MAWVLDPANELKLHAVDAAGTRASTTYWIDDGETDPGGGAAAAIASAVQGISEDAIYLVEILRRAHWDAPVTPVTGPYPRAADKVKLEFASTNGITTLMEVPGPNSTILDSGKINVDPADVALAAFVTYALTYLKDSEGGMLIALKKGYRRRPPRRKHQ